MFPGSSSLVEVLRSTLKQLEQNEDLASDDPALAELRASILRTIAEIEVGKTPKSPTQQRILWITPKPRAVQLEPEVHSPEPELGQPGAAGETPTAKTIAISSGKSSSRKLRNRAASGRRSG